MSDHEITEAMIAYGGGFVQCLGRLYRQADLINRATLVSAFKHYFDEYTEIARLAGERKSKNVSSN